MAQLAVLRSLLTGLSEAERADPAARARRFGSSVGTIETLLAELGTEPDATAPAEDGSWREALGAVDYPGSDRQLVERGAYKLRHLADQRWAEPGTPLPGWGDLAVGLGLPAGEATRRHAVDAVATLLAAENVLVPDGDWWRFGPARERTEMPGISPIAARLAAHIRARKVCAGARTSARGLAAWIGEDPKHTAFGVALDQLRHHRVLLPGSARPYVVTELYGAEPRWVSRVDRAARAHRAASHTGATDGMSALIPSLRAAVTDPDFTAAPGFRQVAGVLAQLIGGGVIGADEVLPHRATMRPLIEDAEVMTSPPNVVAAYQALGESGYVRRPGNRKVATEPDAWTPTQVFIGAATRRRDVH